MSTNNSTRESWGSKIGFILTAAGAAVGLGNIQRFPYLVAQEGGAAFVLVYLLCVFLLGIPLIMLEFSFGRFMRLNPYSAIKKNHPKSLYRYAGLLAILCAFFILSYYSVATGWTLTQVAHSLLSKTVLFSDMSRTPSMYWPYTALSLFVTFIVVSKGVQNGLEKLCKILMPTLILLMVCFVIYSLSLPNSMKGLRFFLQPDFSVITPKTFLHALGQAFFSLSIGEAVLSVYGSYTDKETNIPNVACWIAGIDTSVALLAGLMIFPALFSIGHPETFQGVGMLYDAIPVIFSSLPFAPVWSALFFLILFIAAMTTCFGLFEIPVVFLMEEKGYNRLQASVRVFAVILPMAFIIGLSKGSIRLLSELKMPFISGIGLYEIMDNLWGALGCGFSALLLIFYTRFCWGIQKPLEEIQNGCSPLFIKYGLPIWKFLLLWFIPLALSIILLSLFF